MDPLNDNNETNLSTQRNQHDSPLLCLPAELRNRIYELAFCGQRIWIRNPAHGSLREVLNITKKWEKSPLTLLATCRQINYEAFPIAYESCTFDLNLSLSW
jgi:hypothetical protein